MSDFLMARLQANVVVYLRASDLFRSTQNDKNNKPFLSSFPDPIFMLCNCTNNDSNKKLYLLFELFKSSFDILLFLVFMLLKKRKLV